MEATLVKPHIIAVDLGYGFTKATNGTVSIIFPSVAGDAVRADFDNELIHASAGRTIEIRPAGRLWFYGQHAQKHSRNPLALFARERTAQADLIEVLLCAAFAELGENGRVSLCTGLPVDYYQDKDELERRLLGEHVFAIDGDLHVVQVCQVAIIPQPFGSFFDQVLDASGQLINAQFARGKVGILDIGTYTTDYALSDGLEYIAKGSGSRTTAMSTVWRVVRDAIKSDWGIEYELHQIDAIIRNGRTVTVQGHVHDITALIAPAVDALAGQVLAGARERWGSARDFSRIVLTGGGADYIKDRVQAVYPHTQVVNMPHLGNLRGFHKYALRKFNK